MQVKFEKEQRDLKAVIGANGAGIFVRATASNHESIYISPTGVAFSELRSLEMLLKQGTGRIPVYEGDEITLTF